MKNLFQSVAAGVGARFVFQQEVRSSAEQPSDEKKVQEALSAYDLDKNKDFKDLSTSLKKGKMTLSVEKEFQSDTEKTPVITVKNKEGAVIAVIKSPLTKVIRGDNPKYFFKDGSIIKVQPDKKRSDVFVEQIPPAGTPSLEDTVLTEKVNFWNEVSLVRNDIQKLKDLRGTRGLRVSVAGIEAANTILEKVEEGSAEEWNQLAKREKSVGIFKEAFLAYEKLYEEGIKIERDTNEVPAGMETLYTSITDEIQKEVDTYGKYAEIYDKLFNSK